MKSLYVIGSSGSGKTAICVGLALKLEEKGLKVSYFKPVGNVAGLTDSDDRDAVLMKELLKIDVSLDEMVPLVTSPLYLTKFQRSKANLEAVRKAYRSFADYDVVIIESTTTPQTMMGIGLDAMALAKTFDSMVLFVSRIRDDFELDDAIFQREALELRGLEVMGTILNNVPRQVLDKAKGVYKPIFEERGYEILGIIPENPEITSPTVKEILDILGGEVIGCEGKQQDLLVEDILVGAMTQESALNYFRRSTNKAVITGGDRPDIALAALETDTSILILTGGLYPDVKVIAKAEEKGVVVLIVPFDTYTTIGKLKSVIRKIAPADKKVINLAKENVEKYCDIDRIIAAVEEP